VKLVRKLKFFIKESWLLLISSFVFGVMIAQADVAWKDKISYNKTFIKFNKVAKEIFPDAADFVVGLDDVEVDLGKNGIARNAVRKAVTSDGETLGWTCICEGYGFVDWIQLIVGVDVKFEHILGYGVLLSSETPGFGDKIKQQYYRNQFTGAPTDELSLGKTGNPESIDSEIIAISGATISSKAVVDMINTCLPQIKTAIQQAGLIETGTQ
jgi:Na+-translocating ferredoxin:NAD+ oxidoreductase subunit G